LLRHKIFRFHFVQGGHVLKSYRLVDAEGLSRKNDERRVQGATYLREQIRSPLVPLWVLSGQSESTAAGRHDALSCNCAVWSVRRFEGFAALAQDDTQFSTVAASNQQLGKPGFAHM